MYKINFFTLILFLLFTASLLSQEKKISITLQSYKNWENAYKLENDKIELVIVTDIGPRILYFGLKNRENIFHEIEYTKEQLKEIKWKNYGGHRLWIAPEDKVNTYQPDNIASNAEIENQVLKIIQKKDPVTQTTKELKIKMHPSKPFVELTHRIRNDGDKDFELSAWALTVLKIGGSAIIPLGKKGSHPENILPSYSITLWPYTKLTDSCWKFDLDYIRFNSMDNCYFPQKIGSSGSEGWVAYEINPIVFIKAYHYIPEANYPDRNSSVEIFSNGKFVELETLGPMKKLKHNELVEHTEYWTIIESNDLKNKKEDINKLRKKMIESFK